MVVIIDMSKSVAANLSFESVTSSNILDKTGRVVRVGIAFKTSCTPEKILLLGIENFINILHFENNK